MYAISASLDTYWPLGSKKSLELEMKDFSLQILKILKGDGCCDTATIEIHDHIELCTIRLKYEIS